MPSVSQATRIALDGQRLRIDRETESGTEVVEVPLPALVAVRTDTSAPAFRIALSALERAAIATHRGYGAVSVDTNAQHSVARIQIPLPGSGTDGTSTKALLTLRGSDGATRQANLSVGDAAERRRLTEPAELFRGLGFQFWTPPVPPVLGPVTPDGPAARAGLAAGDRVIAIDGTRVSDFRQIVDYISARPGERVTIEYARAGATHSVQVTVASEEAGGKLVGVWVTLGRYDVVEVFEAPDDDTALEIVTKLSHHGAEQTETLRAFTRDEAEEIIKKL